jgi:type II secretory pathway component PulF
MTVRGESTLAGLAAGGVLLVWFDLGLLAFYVPRLLFYWMQLGTPLSFAQRLLVALSQFVRYNWWLFLPALLAGTGMVFWWCLHTIRKAHQARAM